MLTLELFGDVFQEEKKNGEGKSRAMAVENIFGQTFTLLLMMCVCHCEKKA